MSYLSNSQKKNARHNIIPASINQPNHHAPNHRGSEFIIVGVKLGEIYIFKQIDDIVYPIAGPSIRKQNVKLINAGVFDFLILSSM